MQSLADKLNPSVVDQKLIEEYFLRSERKKDDKIWIKEHRVKIIEELNKLEVNKKDYGSFRVKMSVPDTSKFDEEKILNFLESKGLKHRAIKEVLDEEKLSQLIDNDIINLKELQEVAWIESKGSPRISVERLPKNEG